MTMWCGACGQPIQTKFGIRFTRQQADILGMIEDVTKGRGGIDGESLAAVFFPGVSKKQAHQRIKSVICHINDQLASTDWRILNKRHYRQGGAVYHLAQVESGAA